jgi:hypothetical protein
MAPANIFDAEGVVMFFFAPDRSRTTDVRSSSDNEAESVSYSTDPSSSSVPYNQSAANYMQRAIKKVIDRRCRIAPSAEANSKS